MYIEAVQWTRRIDAGFSRGGSGSVLGYSVLDAWFIMLPWARFFSDISVYAWSYSSDHHCCSLWSVIHQNTILTMRPVSSFIRAPKPIQPHSGRTVVHPKFSRRVKLVT